MGKILIIGSSNTDLITTMKRFPAPGETIEGTGFFTAMGGKGANQAVAALRSGGDASFITSLGTDVNGQTALDYYKQQGLDVSMSLIVDGIPSGTAVILVNETGENCIVITPGANNKLSPEYIQGLENAIQEAGLIVLQMEIPYETVCTVCEMAKKYGRKVMLNVAPARKVDESLLRTIEILVVNETEAEIITGRKLEENNIEVMADTLLSMGPKVVLITLGDKGCFLKTEGEKYIIPAFKVKPVDTTAAGDTFCGAVAAEYMRGNNWSEILKFASAAAAISVTRMGAQPSIPKRSEIQQFLNS
jgi:ribokinase